MKNFLIAAIIVLASSSSFAQAPASGSETYFYKLSKSLRGITPTMAERTEFETAAAQNRAEEFVQLKIQDYLKDPRFRFKLKMKYDELLLLSPATNLNLAPDGVTSFDRLVYGVLRDNKSWDELLLAKTFEYLRRSQFNFPIPETAFFEGALNGGLTQETFEQYLKPSPQDKLETYQFTPDDLRVAGVLTTPRFLARYVNTALNKDRRRAAAVFKIFLCESMAPSVPANDAAGERQDFDSIFPDHKNLTEEQIRSNIKSDVHGDRPDCKACHYKLDPLGQTFALSSAMLAFQPSPGALRYKGKDGRNVDIPLRGFGDLATQITLQPEYAQCQVRHFWNWYVGKDIPVSRAQEMSLVAKFNEVGRKPQDFIAYLVGLPEYRQRPVALTEDQLLARRAVRVLKNCNACHSTQDKDLDMKEWDMTDLPYGKSPMERARAIRKIKKAIDFDHDGANKEMPPNDSLWKLSSDDFNALKKWILKGAPDFEGTPQTNIEGSR